MKIALITLGCPKNLVDAEVMMGLLYEAGHELTGEPLGSDVTIVNTCSFISAAVEESREIIESCLAAKRAGQLGAVVVAGCLPQRYGRATLSMFPDVDGVVACSAFEEIVGAVQVIADGERPFLVHEPTNLYDHDSARIRGTPAHLAYVKISEGCDNRCTYCTIPSIRGRLRSRNADSVVAEATELVESGARELCVIAQDTTAYGTDIASEIGLEGLLRRLGRVGAPWVRVLYTHPAHVSDELLSVVRDEPAVLPYLDVPVQHVADGVLRAMGRGIGGARIRELFDKARETIPGLTIRSSVMLGFPGETESDFSELLAFVRDGYVDHLGVFEFSPEPGTVAAKMEGQIPEEVVSSRAAAIHEEARRLAARRGDLLIGATVMALADEEGSGHMASQAWELDGSLLWDAAPGAWPAPGSFFEARVTGSRDFDVLATPLRRAA